MADKIEVTNMDSKEPEFLDGKGLTTLSELEIEEWIILVEFKLGSTMRGLAKRYKRKVPEIEEIIRRKWDELNHYKPLARRTK